MKLTKMMATLFLLIPLTSFSQELGQRISQDDSAELANKAGTAGNDSNLLIVFYVQIMPDDFVMQLHRF